MPRASLKYIGVSGRTSPAETGQRDPGRKNVILRDIINIMATGACGIDCTVCGLHVRGQCSSCGAGTSDAAKEKLDAQYTKFGLGCSILECAMGRKLDYCSRDCEDFPCSLYKRGPYPYSEGYLTMQEHRRQQRKSCTLDQAWPKNEKLFWDEFGRMDASVVCKLARVSPMDNGRYNVKCLNEHWVVNPEKRAIKKAYGPAAGEWDRRMPFLILAYLIKCGETEPTGRMISPREVLPGLNYFQGDHSLITTELEETFGQSKELFLEAGVSLGGEPTGQADASMKFFMFPKFPVEYLLWPADEEFPARISILLDRNSQYLYPVNIIYQAVNLLSHRLIFAAHDFEKDE